MCLGVTKFHKDTDENSNVTSKLHSNIPYLNIVITKIFSHVFKIISLICQIKCTLANITVFTVFCIILWLYYFFCHFGSGADLSFWNWGLSNLNWEFCVVKSTILGTWCRNFDQLGFILSTRLDDIGMFWAVLGCFWKKSFKLGKSLTINWKNCMKLNHFTDWEWGLLYAPNRALISPCGCFYKRCKCI